jgi:hypothetical protein
VKNKLGTPALLPNPDERKPLRHFEGEAILYFLIFAGL